MERLKKMAETVVLVALLILGFENADPKQNMVITHPNLRFNPVMI
jgi:hypothetical protein